MAGNSVTVTVDGKNNATPAFVSAAKGAKTFGDAAEITAKQVKQLNEKIESTETKARLLAQAEERAAEKARRLAADLAAAKHQLAENGDETGKLATKISRLTTDTRFAAVATEEYRRAANRAAADAREQARAYDKVADNARQAARAVAMFGASTKLAGGKKNPVPASGGALSDISAGFLKGGFGGASSALEGTLGTPVVGPVLLAAGAAASIPAASFVGGALGGGIGAAGAAAGAGAGLAGAWMGDPEKYGGMWTSMIDRVKKRWLDSSASFGPELASGLKTVDNALRNLPIEKVLALSHGLSTPLVTGAAQGLGGVVDGLAESLRGAQPIVNTLGPAIGNLGHDIGDSFRIISLGSEGGADALGDMVGAVGFTIKAVAVLIGGLEVAYTTMERFGSAVVDVNKAIPGMGPLLDASIRQFFDIRSSGIVAARTLDDVSTSSDRFGASIGQSVSDSAALTLQTLEMNDALAIARTTLLGLADANLAVAQGWLDLKDGLKDGAKTLDLNTQAGIDNVRVIESQVAALERQRQQAIETGGGTVDAINAANTAYDASIEKLRQAAYAAGFNKQQVDALIGSLSAVKPVTTAEVRVPGLATALSQGESLRQRLDQIDGRVAVADVIVRYSTRGQSLNAPLRTGGIPHAATGGPQDRETVVGEDGPEIVSMPSGSMVYPASNTRQRLSQGGGQTVAVRLDITGDGMVYELVMAAMREGKIQVPHSAIV